MESIKLAPPLPSNLPTHNRPGNTIKRPPEETVAPRVAKSGRYQVFDYEVLTHKEKIVQNFLKQSRFPHDKDDPKLQGSLQTSIYFGAPVIQHAARCIPVCRTIEKFLSMRDIVTLACLNGDYRLLISTLIEKYYSHSPAIQANYRSLWQSQFASPPERLTQWLGKHFDKSDKAWVKEDPLRQAALHRYLCNTVDATKYITTISLEFIGHTCCMTTLSNGQIACGSYDDILVWDLSKPGNERCVAILPGHAGWVNAILELASGQIVSCSDDLTLRIWDLSRPYKEQCVAVLNGHTDWINSILELAGGQIVSCSDDLTLKVWDLGKPEEEQCLATLYGHSGWINSIAMLPDAQIVSCSNDRTLRVWDLRKPEGEQCVAILSGHTGLVNSVSVLADGQIISCSNDHTLRVWDLSKPNRERCVAILSGHTDWVNGVLVLADGRIISCSNDCTLRVWDLTKPEREQCVAILHGHAGRIKNISVLADGQIISCSVGLTLRVWDLPAAIDLDKGLLPDMPV